MCVANNIHVDGLARFIMCALKVEAYVLLILGDVHVGVLHVTV